MGVIYNMYDIIQTYKYIFVCFLIGIIIDFVIGGPLYTITEKPSILDSIGNCLNEMSKLIEISST